ncbi:MAG: hypothetical protein K9K66_19030 [Desulfarculaceae bacterium]|nr:hypothetical protein [Desulfarculaceae bacterium]MCF8073597.1 hypothetical protein [Desulfarculaceae bacterium]MCF8103754.1 hypothetical protein [Desulfarculaceae bacterium]MCF8115687.1 hypothetical protein [Desulfarculaceae bacterium]
MKKTLGIALTVLCIVCLLLIVGATVVKPLIFTWGSSDKELTMPMPGDHRAPFISSTRAITINAPIARVWEWLIQLGADRGGFYSYWFVEHSLGYKYRAQDRVEAQFKDMKVGRVVPTSLNEPNTAIKYSFQVVEVDPGRYFVLNNWGCFLLREINSQQTRLVIRTHGRPLATWSERLRYFFEMPLHYIMERRMLMGIKARAEAGAGKPFSSTTDILWFLGICLSPIGILVMLLVGSRLTVRLFAALYSLVWLWVFLILDPIPIYGWLLCLIIAIHLAWLFKTRARSAPR